MVFYFYFQSSFYAHNSKAVNWLTPIIYQFDFLAVMINILSIHLALSPLDDSHDDSNYNIWYLSIGIKAEA